MPGYRGIRAGGRILFLNDGHAVSDDCRGAHGDEIPWKHTFRGRRLLGFQHGDAYTNLGGAGNPGGMDARQARLPDARVPCEFRDSDTGVLGEFLYENKAR